MKTEPGLFAFIVTAIIVSGAVLFSASMLARRASKTYTAILAALASIVVCTGGLWLVEEPSAARTLALASATVLLPLGAWVQVRAFGFGWLRSTVGIAADGTLAVLWIVGLLFFEMIATGDGGPGFAQYVPICVLTFLVAQIALPPILVRAWPGRKTIPPRVPVPGEYPRA